MLDKVHDHWPYGRTISFSEHFFRLSDDQLCTMSNQEKSDPTDQVLLCHRQSMPASLKIHLSSNTCVWSSISDILGTERCLKKKRKRWAWARNQPRVQHLGCQTYISSRLQIIQNLVWKFASQDLDWEAERIPRARQLHRPASQGWWWRGWVPQGADSIKLKSQLKIYPFFRRCLHPSLLCYGVFFTSRHRFRQQTSPSSRLLG